MLPQQVGFVCAVLALVCCACSLFGSLGRCGEGCSPPRELGALSWKASGQLQLLPSQIGPQGFPSPPGVGGGVVLTQEG